MAGRPAIHALNRRFIAAQTTNSVRFSTLQPMTTSPTPAPPLPRSITVPFSTVLRHWWSLEEQPPGSAWQYVLATAFYNTVMGLGISLLILLVNPRSPILSVIGGNILIAQCIGFSIHTGFSAYFAWTRKAWRNTLSPLADRSIHILIPMAGVFTGYVLAYAISGGNFLALIAANPRAGLGTLLFGLLMCLMWYLVMDGQTRRLRAEADEAHALANAEALLKQASEAELRALQAQIEPHFLFNTLANVQALIDYEPTKAKRMLETFIDYLRATLDASRRTQATLGDEILLLERYMQLMQVRMGPRLQVVWDVSTELQTHPFAPLLLQPLIENAIKYGLEPKIEGGTITVTAKEFKGRITITVQDDGMGLDHPPAARKPMAGGAGTGIKNIAARLRSTFGSDASVTVANMTAGVAGSEGCRATIEFSDQRKALP